MAYKRKVVAVADMHTGSRFALWPTGFKTTEGNDLSAQMSTGQKRLLKYWREFVKICNEEYKPDTVFLLGDLVQGTHRAEFGRELLTADLNEQIEACVELLGPLCKEKKVVAVSGTKYHQSLDMRLHKIIAEKLGGEYLGLLGNVKLKGTNVVARLLHGDSSASIYRSTVMDRELLFQRAAETLKKAPRVNITLAGHWHWYAHLELSDRHWVQVPGWMTWFPWKGTNYARMQPDIGGVVVLIDDRDRIEVHPILFPTVHIADQLGEV